MMVAAAFARQVLALRVLFVIMEDALHASPIVMMACVMIQPTMIVMAVERTIALLLVPLPTAVSRANVSCVPRIVRARIVEMTDVGVLAVRAAAQPPNAIFPGNAFVNQTVPPVIVDQTAAV